MLELMTLKEVAKKFPTVYSGLRTFRRRATFAIAGRDYRTEDAVRSFSPNSAGDRASVAALALQSVKQTFPLLAELAIRHCKQKPEEITAEEFWKNNGSSQLCDQLRELFNQYGSDKSTYHDYHYIYAPMLSSPANVKNVLEIGLGTNNTDVASHMGATGRPGASLRAFRDFLPNAEIYGADIDRRILFQEERIRTFFVDQTDLQSFKELESVDAKFDLIIDDGLHSPNANLAVLLFGLDKVAPGGWIVVEDIGESARSIWQVMASLALTDYRSYLITAKNGLVFAARRDDHCK